MRMPSAASARTEDSRPGPGPRISTSRFLIPCSMAARPATSDATCAANGVDLREPLKPWPPEEAQDKALPWRSVIVMIVLLKDACTWQTPSDTFLRTFLRTRCAALLAGALAMSDLFPDLFLQRLGSLARTLAGAGIVTRALPAHGQATAMAEAAVAAD